MIDIPKEDYIHKEENGKQITYCTLRQQLKHFIGLDYKKPYKRHGRLFYKPYRNGFSTGKNYKLFDECVELGYMRKYIHDGFDCISGVTYHLTRKGLDWLGKELGIVIRDMDRR